jgi:BMFP domain-containing protein YqiC
MKRSLARAWQTVRDIADTIRSFTDRQAAALAIVSGLVFGILVVVWLMLSTRTALLNERIDQLDAQQTQLMDQMSQTLLDIGEATAPKAMQERARRLGYRPAERIEFLAAITNTTVVTK